MESIPISNDFNFFPNQSESVLLFLLSISSIISVSFSLCWVKINFDCILKELILFI